MIYFDNAATSIPKPRSVGIAIQKALKECGNPGRSGHIFSLTAAETIFQCRNKLAKIFNTRPEYVVFTSGATESLNLSIKGSYRYGGVAVVSSLEHNSVMRPLNALRKSGELVVRQFLVDINSDDVTLDNFSAVSKSASMVVLTHASNVCGRILPISQIRKIANPEAIFILDASQTAGHIPIDIVELGVDIICVPAHKGLCGPTGIGAMIINPYSDIIIDPLVHGGTGTNSKSLEMPELYPERLEAGTVNVCGIAGFSAALDEYEIFPETNNLYSYLIGEMKNMVDITLYGEPKKENFENYVPVALFNKKDIDCETLCDKLAEKGFALRAGYHCSPNAHLTLGTYDIGGVRVSLGRYNNRREIDKFLTALKDI